MEMREGRKECFVVEDWVRIPRASWSLSRVVSWRENVSIAGDASN